METLLVAAVLIVFGLAAALNGYLLFRVLLPIMGFLLGYGIGFAGLQAALGTGFASTTIAVLVGLFVGAVLAALSYFYFTIAVTVFGASIVAGAFAFLGQAIGLREEGFLVFLLALSGAIIGGLVVLRAALQDRLVVYLSAFLGVGLVLVGVMLGAGDLTMAELNEAGILATIRDTVDTSFIWLFAWIGGSLMASLVQFAIIQANVWPENLNYEPTKK
jgi:predicted outer membrane lipoprotein